MPQEATKERWRIDGVGVGVKQDSNTKPGIISVPLPLLWETWLNASVQQHNSHKATVLSY